MGFLIEVYQNVLKFKVVVDRATLVDQFEDLQELTRNIQSLVNVRSIGAFKILFKRQLVFGHDVVREQFGVITALILLFYDFAEV